MAIDAFTKLLLHMNGVNGGVSFPDSSLAPHVMTAYGGVITSTAQSKFNGSSGYFNGTGAFLTTPGIADFQFGNGDFTIEMFLLQIDGNGVFFTIGNDLNNRFYLQIFGGKLRLAWAIAGVYTTRDGSTTVTANAWHHVALVRTGGQMRIYLDGVLENGGADYVLPVYTSPVSIGSDILYSGGSSGFHGYMAELRISKGVARYTSDFTPPGVPFEDATPVAVDCPCGSSVKELIAMSLRLSGSYSSGDNINPKVYGEALLQLRLMMMAWQAEKLTIPDQSLRSFVLTPNKGSYTVGPGGDFDGKRSLKMVGGYLRLMDNTTDRPIKILNTSEEYDSIAVKSNKGTPYRVYYDPQICKGVLYVYPVPDQAYTLFLDAWDPLDLPTTITGTICIPDEWKNAIVFNLALRVRAEHADKEAPMFVQAEAERSKQALKDFNTSIPRAGFDIFSRQRGRNFAQDYLYGVR